MKIVIPIRAKSINCFYRCSGGHFYLSKINRDYIASLKEHLSTFWDTTQILVGKISVSVTLYFKGKKEIDCDNCLKAIFDAMQGIIIDNDKQIYHLDATKILNAVEDSIEIEITPFEEMTVYDVV